MFKKLGIQIAGSIEITGRLSDLENIKKDNGEIDVHLMDILCLSGKPA